MSQSEDINDMISKLPKELQKMLIEVFKDAPTTPARYRKQVEKAFIVDCTIMCNLCGATTTVTKESSVEKPLKAYISNCGACKSRLVILGADVLADKLIRLFRIDAPPCQYREMNWNRNDEELLKEVTEEVDKVVEEVYAERENLLEIVQEVQEEIQRDEGVQEGDDLPI